MHATTRTRVIVVAVAAVIAAAVVFAVVHARGENLNVGPPSSPHAVAALGHHPRPCPPRNKHCRPVKPPQPPPSCVWVVGGAIGDVPHCVPS